MKFEPGKDRDGKTPLLDDGLPAFAQCGQYRISRAKIPSGYVSDAWLKQYDEQGRWAPALPLASGVTSQKAKNACERHANATGEPI